MTQAGVLGCVGPSNQRGRSAVCPYRIRRAMVAVAVTKRMMKCMTGMTKRPVSRGERMRRKVTRKRIVVRVLTGEGRRKRNASSWGAREEVHGVWKRKGAVFEAVRGRSCASCERKASLSAPNPLPGKQAPLALDYGAAEVCSKLHLGEGSVLGIPWVASSGMTGTAHGSASRPRHRGSVNHGRADGVGVEVKSTAAVTVKVAVTGCRAMRCELLHRQARISRKRSRSSVERERKGKSASTPQPLDGVSRSFLLRARPRPIDDDSLRLREMHGSRGTCTNMEWSRSESRIEVHSRPLLGKHVR